MLSEKKYTVPKDWFFSIHVGFFPAFKLGGRGSVFTSKLLFIISEGLIMAQTVQMLSYLHSKLQPIGLYECTGSKNNTKWIYCSKWCCNLGNDQRNWCQTVTNSLNMMLIAVMEYLKPYVSITSEKIHFILRQPHFLVTVKGWMQISKNTEKKQSLFRVDLRSSCFEAFRTQLCEDNITFLDQEIPKNILV